MRILTPVLGFVLLSPCSAADPLTVELSKAEFQIIPMATPSKIPILLTVRGGRPPYQVSASGDAITLQPHGGMNPTMAQYRILPKKPGIADITVKDAAGETRNARFTVTAAPGPLNVTLSDTIIDLGKSVTLTISGGVPPYRVDLPSGTRFKPERLSDSQYRLTGMVAGGGIFRVFDSKQSERAFTLRAALLKAQLARTSALPGETTDLTFSGGAAQHSLACEPVDAASFTMKSATAFTITFRKAGQGTLVLKDAEGQSARLPFTVNAPAPPPPPPVPFGLTTSASSIHVQDCPLSPREALITLKGAAGAVTFTQTPPRLTLTKVNETTYKATGRYPGGEVITLSGKDVTGKFSAIQIYLNRPLAVKGPDRDLIVPENKPGRVVSAAPVHILILNGEGPFKVDVRNPDLVQAGPVQDGRRPTYDRPTEVAATIPLIGKAPGNAKILVGDKYGWTEVLVKVVKLP